MFIPDWALWILGLFLWLTITAYVGQSRGNYDFVSPLLGAGVFFIGIAFGIGYWIAT